MADTAAVHVSIDEVDFDSLSFTDISVVFFRKIITVIPASLPLLRNATNYLYQTPQVHLVLEAILFLVVLRLMFGKKYNPSKKDRLSKEEEDELCHEWIPDSLVPCYSKDADIGDSSVIITGPMSSSVICNGETKLNAASYNFLGMTDREELKDTAVEAIKKYGVGSCGPRGFYGTVDIHETLEQRLASFLNVEEIIIYSYGFSTISSAIPAYAKRGDILFVDDGVSFATQRGIVASRSSVRSFKHNDMEDLERLLLEQKMLDQKDPKKAAMSRRFIIVEGLYANHGDFVPLPKLVSLKYKYKVRIIMEESMSFGCIGDTGRGMTEYFGVDVTDIDLIVGSLSNSLGSIGGFCAGSTFVVDHQRLSGLGYCFSASLPPLLSAGAVTAIDVLEKNPDLPKELRKKSKKFKELMDTKLIGSVLDWTGPLDSPITHLYVRRSSGIPADRALLDDIVVAARSAGVVVSRARYVDNEEMYKQRPSIRVVISAAHTDENIASIATAFSDAVKSLGN